MTASTILMIFPAVVAFAAATDLLTMTIPNRITLGLAAAFFAVAPLTGLPLDQILIHAGAGLLVLVVSIVLFAVGGFGGGDAKLLAAAALWIGFDQLLPFLVYVTIFGGVLAFAILYYRSIPILSPNAPDWAHNLHRRGSGIPYGIAIASAALMVFPHTNLVVGTIA